MTTQPTVLIIDDEESIRFSIQGILEDNGYDVLEAENGEEGLEIVQKSKPDLVFLDIWLPGMDGLAVLDAIEKIDAYLPVVMISGHGNIETAVNAIKKGAFDFIEKPLSLEKVLIAAQKAMEFSVLQQENIDLRSRLDTGRTTRLTGKSEAIVQLKQQIEQVAPTDSWVLITGENGTGKEIVARSVHALSQRASKPLIAVNCAAIPEELIESELFGHVKGAFTGAEQAKEGKFEKAHKGTLFLDEIADMSLKTQAKILRILQEQRFERVGGNETITVNVRVIAATNKDLQQEMKEGRFREDLYFRLNVFPLHVPPLRDRASDIPLFIHEFIESMAEKEHFKPITFSEEALDVLSQYSWPGNVRELKNFLERMLIVTTDSVVEVSQIPPEYKNVQAAKSLNQREGIPGSLDFKEARNLFEKKFLEDRLKEYAGNVSKLAEAIGLERSYLYRKLKAYNIQVKEH